MNTPIPSTPDLEGLSKAVQEFQPNPRRVPFNGLKSAHDSIVELRKRKISYSAIAELLRQHGIKTSRARVAEYGRIVLDGGRSRKRRKRGVTAPAANVTALPQNTPVMSEKLAPAMPMSAPNSDMALRPKENSAFISRGPRIAKIEQLPPDEAKEFLDSLKSVGNTPKP